MSHFIQDNQAVIETKDGLLTLIIKGGDNNVSSGQTNKRCSSWFIHRTFKTFEDYRNYINELVFSNVTGGMWQFQSLKNKLLNGYTEYEAIAINRFLNAYKNRITVDVDLTEVKYENVNNFVSLVENKIKEKGFKLVNQDGYYSSIYTSYYYNNEEKFMDFYNYSLKPVNSIKTEYSDYETFVNKYKDKTLAECLQDIEFCKEISSKYSKSYDGIGSLSCSVRYEIPYENFKILATTKPIKTIGMWEANFKILFRNYPSQMKQLREEGYIKLFEEAVEEDNKTTYPCRDTKENLSFYKEYKDEDFLAIIKEIEEEKNNEVSNAKEVFLKQWNKMVDYAWYKNTNEKLPREVKIMEEAFNVGNFKLEDFNKNELVSMIDLARRHKGQLKKNQKVIKDFAKLIIEKYSVLIKDDEKEILIKYFDIKQPKEKKVSRATLSAATTVGVLYSQDLLNIFANGTLF